jgi:hypothetical protein
VKSKWCNPLEKMKGWDLIKISRTVKNQSKNASFWPFLELKFVLILCHLMTWFLNYHSIKCTANINANFKRVNLYILNHKWIKKIHNFSLPFNLM